MSRIVGFLIAAAVAFPALAQTGGHASLVAKAKTEIAKGLKDPDSAKFRNIGVYKSTTGKGGVSVCGEINAKNSYGAYNGFRGFMVAEGFALIDGEESAGLTYESLAPNLCHEKVASAK